ncbi:hypothetical protein F8M41_000074 [Gigaspora margarita]|uniref:Uncharacterized protein n=1 Tax=Gigaspora margarita TaxID=4874 RepID=A0A8H4EVR5_GIGMA|nr:hypothetical protein F8M41_000074 [Gigaspora margarita]
MFFDQQQENECELYYQLETDNTTAIEVVKEEFTFVNSSFIPDLERTDSEYYIVCFPALHGTVIEIVRTYFNLHSKIPTNNGQFLSLKEIRTKAITCTHVIPDQANHLQQLLTGIIIPSWFEEFKKEWRNLLTKSVNATESQYFIDLECRICSCLSFFEVASSYAST